MPESRSEASAFETRLEAMDRRLRELQEELAPVAPVAPARLHAAPDRPPAVRPAPAPAPAQASAPAPRDETMTQLHRSLIAALRELVAGYERVAGLAAAGAAPPPASAGVTISAGPFDGRAAVRDFERAVSALPGVRAVVVRGYEPGDRTILDVELG